MSTPGPQRRTPRETAEGDRRTCGSCGATLARDNTGHLCSRCLRDQRDHLRTPPHLPDDFWDTNDFRAAFERRHIGKVLKVYRNHPRHRQVFGKALSQSTLGRWLNMEQSQISKIENASEPEPNTKIVELYAEMLHIPRHLLWIVPEGHTLSTYANSTDLIVVDSSASADIGSTEDEIAALELSRRVASSDVGNTTLTQLEEAFDSLATAYPVTPPGVLLPRIRGHIGYVTRLMDNRKTLADHKRLITVGGWLSLLAATVNIDLNRYKAASANLTAASNLARDVENDEIRAWCFETEAWRVLTDGDYRRAIELSQAAQNLAPAGSSALIQSTAQEGRALARLGKSKETYEVVNRVHGFVSSLARPTQPEHHYRYDPDKSTAYTATTLAWVGDPAAESYAREVIARLSPSEDAGKWPRRVATAKLDLSLALIAGNQLDEASATAQQAILSGRIVPSNRWRAAEIVNTIETRQLPDATELRDALNTMCPPPSDPHS
jgi:hypothetical protein